MNAVWEALRERAVSISFAGDAFDFDISWLGLMAVIAVALIWRRL